MVAPCLSKISKNTMNKSLMMFFVDLYKIKKDKTEKLS